MGRIVDSHRKRCQALPDAKNTVRNILPKPTLGILNEEEKARLFDYIKSLKKSSIRTFSE